MTKPGDPDDPFNEPTAPLNPEQPPVQGPGPGPEPQPGGQLPPGGGYPPPPGGQPPPQGAYPPPPGGFPAGGFGPQARPSYGAYGQNPQAPYGYHPITGVPFSDKSKLIAGLLQILVPIGIGRFYIGDVSTGVWQLVVTILTCGLGAIWPLIDGILMLVGNVTDPQGRPLRDGT